VHGWVYEPEEDSALRALALRAFAEALDLPGDDALASARFRERASAFLVDNERGKALTVRIGEQRSVLAASRPSGHVHDTLMLPFEDGETPRAGPGRWIDVALDGQDPTRPSVTTQALLLPPEGLSVISDIDDTVKLSDVHDRRALLERTFLRPFEAVEGTAERYRAWERAGASFHFVSGSPWQLHEPLAALLAQAGFPRATLHLRELRWKSSSALSLFADPEAVKRPQLELLLTTFPARQFVLVGDSAEQDPETYADLARKYPGRILLIAIRDITGEARTGDRYAAVFHDLPDELWVLWTRAEEIPRLAFETGR
jgi:phosphatidate phosphatase APP1